MAIAPASITYFAAAGDTLTSIAQNLTRNGNNRIALGKLNGLGLVPVKTVIERHRGQIGFTSKVGQGTTFTIELPRSNH